MATIPKPKSPPDLLFKCDCGCGQQLGVNFFGDQQMEFNVREDGRHRWAGVVVNKDQIDAIMDLWIKKNE